MRRAEADRPQSRAWRKRDAPPTPAKSDLRSLTAWMQDKAAIPLEGKPEACRKGAGETLMTRAELGDLRLNLALAALIVVLAIASLMVGPAGLSPREALTGLFGSGDPAAVIVVRDIRLPRTLLAILIGATFGLSGAALQGLLRN